MSRAKVRGRIGLVAGVVLAAASMLGLTAPAFGQTDGGSEPKEEDAKVEREGYFTAPADGAVPATLTNEFPPGVVCILVPQACGTTTQPVAGPLRDATKPVTGADLPDYQSQQPVEPETLPVGLLGGKPRYTSYLKFALPAIPSDSFIDRFDLVMSQTDVSYALESPAFRRAILAGLVSYQNESPDEFVRFVGEVANNTTPLAETAPTGIELCAVTGPWEGEPSQDASTQPPRDCIFGANGVFDEDHETWTFDLSFLAQAWIDGDVPNEGVYLGPIGANNLAFGDPDTSTNWQISLGGGGNEAPPEIRYAFSAGFGDESLDDLGGELTLDDTEFEGDFGGEVVGSVDSFSPTFDPAADTSLFAGAEPSTAESAETATGPLRAQLAGESRPRTPWWLWLLLPLGLGMAYLFGRSLEESPPAGRAGRGALTRLVTAEEGTR